MNDISIPNRASRSLWGRGYRHQLGRNRAKNVTRYTQLGLYANVNTDL
ncbi:MAG: hypothetical protein R3B93_25990 [Bacteroidia bacterium]